MAWSIEGRYFESCSCQAPCPCTASLDMGADLDYCRALLVFEITSGDVEGIDVGGVTVVAVADTPKFMNEGNWRLGVVIDDQASDEQAEKVGAVFGGQLGGPMEALGPLVGEQLGLERLPVEITHDGHKHAIRIGGGDGADVEIEDVVPFGSETGEPTFVGNVFHPAGSELTISRALRSNINLFGVEFEGRGGFSAARFAWAA